MFLVSKIHPTSEDKGGGGGGNCLNCDLDPN